MVPLCSTTWRAEYKRVRLSNRGLANHRAVSATSESNELVAAFLVTSESSDLMTGSCRSYTAARPATSKIQALHDAKSSYDPDSIPQSDLPAGTPGRGGGPGRSVRP